MPFHRYNVLQVEVLANTPGYWRSPSAKDLQILCLLFLPGIPENRHLPSAPHSPAWTPYPSSAPPSSTVRASLIQLSPDLLLCDPQTVHTKETGAHPVALLTLVRLIYTRKLAYV